MYIGKVERDCLEAEKGEGHSGDISRRIKPRHTVQTAIGGRGGRAGGVDISRKLLLIVGKQIFTAFLGPLLLLLFKGKNNWGFMVFFPVRLPMHTVQLHK